MTTIRTIADAAGVSPATVSRVMNGTRSVSEELSRRVHEALAEHDFRPNPIARALKGASTGTLGVVISDFANPFFTAVVRGVEEVALAAEYSVILCNSDEDPEREHRYLDLLRQKRITGVILSPCDLHDPAAYASMEDVPLVLIDREVPGLRADIVRVDNYRGAFDAVAYLIALGHRRIATIAGPQTVTTGAERLSGFRAALDGAGIDVPEDYVRFGDFRQGTGYDHARHLLELEPRPTAVFVSNNLMTLGAMIAFTEAGVAIPRDLSIIGFDDVDWARLSSPKLTVVAQPAHEVGVDSAQLLLQRVSEREATERRTVLLTPELVVRESTAPPLDAT